MHSNFNKEQVSLVKEKRRKFTLAAADFIWKLFARVLWDFSISLQIVIGQKALLIYKDFS